MQKPGCGNQDDLIMKGGTICSLKTECDDMIGPAICCRYTGKKGFE